MSETLLLILLAIFFLAGVALAVLQLPGIWLIVASAAAYDWYHGWERIGWKWLVALGIVALFAEVFEAAAGMLAARRAGASRRAAVGALVGGFAGMILLSIPIPVVGTIIGGMLGCFVGACAAELTVRDDVAAGVRVGVFATIGRAMGLAAKTGAALAIAGTALVLAIRGAW